MDKLAAFVETLPGILVAGEFLLDRHTIRIWKGTTPLELSLRQFCLLAVFMQHVGKPISRDTLKEIVWGVESTVGANNVDAEIMRLRRAIADRKGNRSIRSVRSVGYVLDLKGRRKSRISKSSGL